MHVEDSKFTGDQSPLSHWAQNIMFLMNHCEINSHKAHLCFISPARFILVSLSGFSLSQKIIVWLFIVDKLALCEKVWLAHVLHFLGGWVMLAFSFYICHIARVQRQSAMQQCPEVTLGGRQMIFPLAVMFSLWWNTILFCLCNFSCFYRRRARY